MSGIRVARDVSFALFCVSFVLFLVAFATPYWFRVDEGIIVDMHHGLWRACESGVLDNCFKLVGSDLNGKFLKVTQAMMILALCCFSAALVAYSLWASKSPNFLREHGATLPGILACVFCSLGGFFNGIAVIVFGRHYYGEYVDVDDIFGWSFTLAIISSIGSILTGLPTIFLVIFCGRGDNSRAGPPAGMIPVPATDSITTTTVVITENTQPYPQGGVSLNPQGVGVVYHPQGGYPPQAGYPQGYPYQQPPPHQGYSIPQPPPQQGYPTAPPRYSQLEQPA